MKKYHIYIKSPASVRFSCITTNGGFTNKETAKEIMHTVWRNNEKIPGTRYELREGNRKVIETLIS